MKLIRNLVSVLVLLPWLTIGAAEEQHTRRGELRRGRLTNQRGHRTTTRELAKSSGKDSSGKSSSGKGTSSTTSSTTTDTTTEVNTNEASETEAESTNEAEVEESQEEEPEEEAEEAAEESNEASAESEADSESSSASTSSTGTTTGWVNGKYFGCLASQRRTNDDCAYTVHSNSYGNMFANYNAENEAVEEEEAEEAEREEDGDAEEEVVVDTPAPTAAPDETTVVTEMNDDTDPYLAFNISQCDTYGSLWAWDVKMSCGNDTTPWNCQCTYAEELMSQGKLTCDDAQYCPTDCPICNNCMTLLGCSNVPIASTASTSSGGSSAAVMVAAAVGVVACMFYQKKRGRRTGKLNDHLMEDDATEASGGKIWMVPVEPADCDENGNRVWLAPIDHESVPDTSDDPGFPDILPGYAQAASRRGPASCATPESRAETAQSADVSVEEPEQSYVASEAVSVTGEQSSYCSSDCSSSYSSVSASTLTMSLDRGTASVYSSPP